MNDKDIIEKVANIYHYTAYGKLMAGIIHNVNGKITLIDTKIQLASMSIESKLENLEKKKDDLRPEDYEYFLKDLSSFKKIVDGLNTFRMELNSILANSNRKVFSENIGERTKFDINQFVKDFHEFFNFYGIYKHNVDVEFELGADKFVNTIHRAAYFIATAIIKNVSEAIKVCESGRGKIIYKTFNDAEKVHLEILSTGLTPDVNNFEDLILTSTKESFEGQISDLKDIFGEGLDLYFANMIAKKNNIEISLVKGNENYSFIISFPGE
ncbi:MAG: hypothetical protein JXR48_17720 [Candidatus Delongbacteria bacterium]|nr:hypothetical protein [Candidatus Delongbacteria bacterium]MBN2836797.1 hypothetical protein [Candidatus Delongbacteria bacterium]